MLQHHRLGQFSTKSLGLFFESSRRIPTKQVSTKCLNGCSGRQGFPVLAFGSKTRAQWIHIEPNPPPSDFQKQEMDKHTSVSWFFCEKPEASNFCPRIFQVQVADVARQKESSVFVGNRPYAPIAPNKSLNNRALNTE